MACAASTGGGIGSGGTQCTAAAVLFALVNSFQRSCLIHYFSLHCSTFPSSLLPCSSPHRPQQPQPRARGDHGGQRHREGVLVVPGDAVRSTASEQARSKYAARVPLTPSCAGGRAGGGIWAHWPGSSHASAPAGPPQLAAGGPGASIFLSGLPTQALLAPVCGGGWSISVVSRAIAMWRWRGSAAAGAAAASVALAPAGAQVHAASASKRRR